LNSLPPIRIAASLLAFFLMLAAASSCSHLGAAWDTGWTQRAAQDRIMLVADHPKTLGLRRLESQLKLYPDLRLFLRTHGWPNFLAETDNDHMRYLVFYYLEPPVAYAARTSRPDNRSMEFSGPYPITQGEIELLGKLRAKHSDAIPAPSTDS
jgi:hypothetical protein